MDNLRDDSEVNLAHRIRYEREMRHWSLADLSQYSGVSKAAISKIERGDTSPTATVLIRIAAAFDLTFAGLLLRAEGGESRLSRLADQPLWKDPATGYQRRQVFARPDHPVEVVEVALPAHKHVVLPASSYLHIRQAVRVIEGQLSIHEGEEAFTLDEGDCLGFGAMSEVTIANKTSSTCRYLVVLSRS